MNDYETFLDRKTHLDGEFGFDARDLPNALFDFQRALVEWACRRGRAAIFADCGLGKTLMELAWAEQVARFGSVGARARRVLLLTPLAVAEQTIREAERFGIQAEHSRDGMLGNHPVVVANYERLHLFRAEDFAGCVCDESSILKSFNGARRNEITAFMRKLPYRLLATATAAPNDWIELGTSSEALGELGHMDMLNRFFKNDNNTSDLSRKWRTQGGSGGNWRLKGHAEQPFWQWVASWARAVRRPSDLGFDDGRFVLPDLVETEHVEAAREKAPGMLFNLPAVGLKEEREEKRRTIRQRCERAATFVSGNRPAICWCHLNDEGDVLSEILGGDAVQVSGADSDDEKERKFLDFSEGRTRVLVVKPRIGAWGLNWQHCALMTYFPSHSYEQYYQAVRRCWRFGQTEPVHVRIVATEGDRAIKENLQRKAKAADDMFSSLVAHMRNALGVGRTRYGKMQAEVPKWLSTIRK